MTAIEIFIQSTNGSGPLTLCLYPQGVDLTYEESRGQCEFSMNWDSIAKLHDALSKAIEEHR